MPRTEALKSLAGPSLSLGPLGAGLLHLLPSALRLPCTNPNWRVGLIVQARETVAVFQPGKDGGLSGVEALGTKSSSVGKFPEMLQH